MLPRLFDNRRVYILGGGPSLDRDTCDRLRGLHAIVINSTAWLAPWAEILFFGDASWCRDHMGLVAAFGGLAVTSSAKAHRRAPEAILVEPPLIPDPAGLTSGHLALALAAAMGAAEIVLLGFDCRTIAGRSHCHNDYAGAWTDSLYRDRVLPTWAGWRQQMTGKGVHVVNATPDSAIAEFRKVTLRNLL
ncbi:MAG TPA: hypothetical protein VGF07_10240 [Stellaceae bacterium]|jgi:hypothetical protein